MVNLSLAAIATAGTYHLPPLTLKSGDDPVFLGRCDEPNQAMLSQELGPESPLTEYRHRNRVHLNDSSGFNNQFCWICCERWKCELRA